MKLFFKMLLPVIIIFVLVSIVVFTAGSVWTKYNVDGTVLMGANILFLAISIVVFIIQYAALNNPNPNVFIRSVMSGMMIKMFTTVLAVLAYVVLVGPTYNKKAVFISLFIYLLYLAAEVGAILKENRSKNVENKS
ncbi:hypothetical protein ACFOWM_13360 [Ferruginibacter yonginensis]|uniref:ATP synthase protein I n=1 Tax=Ferruginibacter yonginensis TaxID=1310416 RepID=A0ABV8QVJ1_9BACT